MQKYGCCVYNLSITSKFLDLNHIIKYNIIKKKNKNDNYNNKRLSLMTTSIEVKINPNILIWARKSAKYEIEEISQKMEMDSNEMEKLEKGEKTLTYVQLLKLAEYYQRPAMLFFNPNMPPFEPDTLHDFRTLPKKTDKKISPKVTFELRSARARRENVISLDDLDEYEIPTFNLNAQLTDDITSLAYDIRKSIKLSKARQDTLKNPSKFLDYCISQFENLGILVFQFYGIKSEEMRGYAISYKKLPIIGINVKEHPHGKLFTLFHELPHLALKTESISNINTYNLKYDIEIFCNKVAAETLVPEKSLLQDPIVQNMTDGTLSEKNLKQLSRNFKVSPEVIIRRLLSTNSLSNEFFKIKKEEWNSYIGGGFQTKKGKEPKKAKKREIKETKVNRKDPNVSKALKRNGIYYTNLVLEAYDNDLITSSDLSDFLGEKLETIEKIKDAISKGE